MLLKNTVLCLLLLSSFGCQEISERWGAFRYPVKEFEVPECEPEVDVEDFQLEDFSSFLGVSFVRSRGGDARLGQTEAYICWRPSHLIVIFENVDRDIRTPYTKRDAPIYKSEAVELFIDGNGDGDDYIELQASPAGVLFDSRFSGGARKNMDKSFNSQFKVRTVLNGTLNDGQDDDKGWRSIWEVPVSDMVDVKGPLQTGQVLHVHMYRINHDHKSEKKIIEALALSPPLKGDFHVLERMARFRLVPMQQKI